MRFTTLAIFFTACTVVVKGQVSLFDLQPPVIWQQIRSSAMSKADVNTNNPAVAKIGIAAAVALAAAFAFSSKDNGNDSNHAESAIAAAVVLPEPNAGTRHKDAPSLTNAAGGVDWSSIDNAEEAELALQVMSGTFCSVAAKRRGEC
jgi:hypothetical protein